MDLTAIANENQGVITPNAGPIIYKTNVRTYEEWGPNRRVLNNVTIRSGQSTSISSNNSVSFSRTISGSVSGISISAAKTISSRVGYTLSTSTSGTWYMVFRPRYKVETGIRNYQPGHGGPVQKNSYTVKVPIYGSYSLVRY